MTTADIVTAAAAVKAAIDATEVDWAELPFFVRPLVKRGFRQRTGRDVAGWRTLLDATARGPIPAELPSALDALIDHWRTAPERARKGMAGSPAQLAMITARLAPRIAAAIALRALVAPR